MRYIPHLRTLCATAICRSTHDTAHLDHLHRQSPLPTPATHQLVSFYSHIFFLHISQFPPSFFFFLNDPAPPEISPLPLHDPLPIPAAPPQSPPPPRSPSPSSLPATGASATNSSAKNRAPSSTRSSRRSSTSRRPPP